MHRLEPPTYLDDLTQLAVPPSQLNEAFVVRGDCRIAQSRLEFSEFIFETLDTFEHVGRLLNRIVARFPPGRRHRAQLGVGDQPNEFLGDRVPIGMGHHDQQ